MCILKCIKRFLNAGVNLKIYILDSILEEKKNYAKAVKMLCIIQRAGD